MYYEKYDLFVTCFLLICRLAYAIWKKKVKPHFKEGSVQNTKVFFSKTHFELGPLHFAETLHNIIYLLIS